MITIHETIDELHRSLRDYIETSYHISSRSLVAQRTKLLNEEGVIYRTPYIESTPKYKKGKRFSDIPQLPESSKTLFERLAKEDDDFTNLLFDPSYSHQVEAIEQNLIHEKNLVITTGTGSGKTESFLLPILGRLSREAREKPQEFSSTAAVRAIVLYPMNALVNDQLGRLRNLLGDKRLVETFQEWSGRPPRFARYTSRTPYPGVRYPQKDSKRLASFEKFFIDLIDKSSSKDENERLEANDLIRTLKEKGKWPAKPNLKEWYGHKGAPWKDKNTGEFIRATTMSFDSELITRHEVQDNPPDILVTNYSMLEYMLMRPIEREIFDATKRWLEENPDEKFTIVLDEAHLYRGAAGAEIGLLIRRLRDRLGISSDRLSVICSTASFNDTDYAPTFASELSGVDKNTFVPITGELDLSDHAVKGTSRDAEILANINLDDLYRSDRDTETSVFQEFFELTGISSTNNLESALYEGLKTYGPMGILINQTMKESKPLYELSTLTFEEGVDERVAKKAVTSLLTMGSMAKEKSSSAGLFPCRVHNFFRGLPGLWVCMDPSCSEIPESLRDGACGKLYSQPVDHCGCGARVLELYTCRNCGTAYGRGYTNNLDNPGALWQDPGESLKTSSRDVSPLYPIDLLLESPVREEEAELAEYDLLTGRINSELESERVRCIFISKNRLVGEEEIFDETRGEFKPCAVCGKRAGHNRSSVQDHQTKGDQPFQALVTRQIQIQRPQVSEASRFAPLRGRKVLTFSDSRQVAARLAPNIQMFSEKDSIRPLVVYGYQRLQKDDTIRELLSLEDLFFAVLLSAEEFGVRLRPELGEGESFDAYEIVAEAFSSGEAPQGVELFKALHDVRSEDTPKSLLNHILGVIVDQFWGFESLALATLKEREDCTKRILEFPDIPGFAESAEAKLGLVRFWIRCWIDSGHGFWLSDVPESWSDRERKEGFRFKVRDPKSRFEAMKRVLPGKASQDIFWGQWAPELHKLLGKTMGSGYVALNGTRLTLSFNDDWIQCLTCKSVHRPIPGISICVDCQSSDVKNLDPDSDPVFLARKGFYRNPVVEALQSDMEPPMALVAAEHTAQLNSPRNEDVFSKAEENELLFQDISLNLHNSRSVERAIDVLTSTTTMEVGIDLGALTGVALRNMPPSRANYQQRAGRAGRRGNSVATVVAYGSADSHDEHYFSVPDQMIRGDVVDPQLTLNNPEITRRHIRAFLLQNYHAARVSINDVTQPADLFSVLGTVESFKDNESTLNRCDFNEWLCANEECLRRRLREWLPDKLKDAERERLLGDFVDDCIHAVDDAIFVESTEVDEVDVDSDFHDLELLVSSNESSGAGLRSDKLLDRLLYCGKLPRYAFPTDVSAFHVFDEARSYSNKHELTYAPQQSLPVALSQYAPGKQVWISGKCYTSGALYSLNRNGVDQAWNEKRIYMECKECGFARTYAVESVTREDSHDCNACGSEGTFGPARYWLRPPGFAHPVDVDAVTSPDEIPESSYATRAKLETGDLGGDEGWSKVNGRIKGIDFRHHLLVSNAGPKKEGYNYCTACGRIEASRTPNPQLGGEHNKPYPDPDNPKCDANLSPSRHVFIGGDFITDIVLFKLEVACPISLNPTSSATHVALRTASEALAKAACRMLEIEPSEITAEYRPAPTAAGKDGFEAEIYLYDTLPGGAGFSSQLAARGTELFEIAHSIVQECPQGCGSSCYRCLRSFSNRLEHRLLDRHVAGQLFGYLLTGECPDFDDYRIEQSVELLYGDLVRSVPAYCEVIPNTQISSPDGMTSIAPILLRDKQKEIAVMIAPAITPQRPTDFDLYQWIKSSYGATVIVIDELLVRANLAAATERVVSEIV